MEREIILSIEYDVLKEFKCSSISEIMFKKLNLEYYKRIKEILNTEYEWEYYYKAYSIVFNHDNIQNEIPRLERSFDEAIHELNEKIVMALNKEANTIYNREIQQRQDILDESLFNPDVVYKLKYLTVQNDNYVIAQQILTDELIDISKEKIEIDNLLDIAMIDDYSNDFSEDEALLFSKDNFVL